MWFLQWVGVFVTGEFLVPRSDPDLGGSVRYQLNWLPGLGSMPVSNIVGAWVERLVAPGTCWGVSALEFEEVNLDVRLDGRNDLGEGCWLSAKQSNLFFAPGGGCMWIDRSFFWTKGGLD